MKKIIVPFFAALLVCGFANAQTKPAKAPAKFAKETKAVSPSKNASPVAKIATEKPKSTITANKPAAVHRKRHHKAVAKKPKSK